jgi:hypothetical protein
MPTVIEPISIPERGIMIEGIAVNTLVDAQLSDSRKTVVMKLKPELFYHGIRLGFLPDLRSQ